MASESPVPGSHAGANVSYDFFSFSANDGTSLPVSAIWPPTGVPSNSAMLGPQPGSSPLIISTVHAPPNLVPSSAVGAAYRNFDDDDDDQDELNTGGPNANPPTVEQSADFLQTLADKAFEWFLIRVDAICIFTHFLCAINCVPGRASQSHVRRSINLAIEMIRRVQPNPKNWTPEDVPISLNGVLCRTTLKNSRFRVAFKAEVSIMRDTLFQRAYISTRKLLAPSHQQLHQFDYPRIVLLRSLDDVETASDWRTTSGDLMWDKLHGYRLFHIDYPGNGGSPVFIWFGRPEIREFLYHFFRQSRSIGFIEVYQLVRNHVGHDEWAEISHATDPMLAFGLAWIVAVVDTDVLRNRGFEDFEITKRRRNHFAEIYHKILAWFKTLRDGTPIPGLDTESRAQALQAIGVLSELSLPDLSVYDSN